MRKVFNFCLLLMTSALLLSNCSEAPVYPETPEIEYKEIIRHANGDSLQITLSFKDGDGDLGLSDEEMSFPYQEFDYVKNGSGEYVEISDSPSNPPYNCYEYLIGEYNIDTPVKNDTILLDRNENHFNYFIEYLIRQPDDTYLTFDFEKLICGSANNRFPILNSNEGPIEGDLSFKINMTDILLAPDPSIYSTYFYNRYIKFKVYIQDRAFNKSNVIETEEVLINF